MIKKIMQIACNLQAKKDSKNEFGNYQYRTAEKIYENLKPLLCEQGLSLTFSEDILQVGDKHYLKCTAFIIDVETKECIERSTVVEIDTNLKGMSQGQKTGASISYARKYLLCGIFLIDNGEDLDKINPKKQLFSHSEKVEITIVKLNKIKDVQKLLNFKELVKQRDINVYNDESVQLAFKYQYNMIINNLKNSK